MKRRTIAVALLLTWFLPAPAPASDKASYLHFMNGLVLERKGNYDSALQEYRTTMLLDPQSVFVYKQALNLALHIGKMSEAAEWAEYVVKIDSASADNWVLYGNVQWAKGNIEGARTAFEKAIALDPESADAVYQLASLWSSKDPDKAIFHLKRYLELKPDDGPDVHYQLAILYNAKSDHANMKEQLLLAKEADSMYPQPRYMLANYYELKNDTAAAIGEYVDLLSIESGNIELLNHIGELYAAPSVSDLASAEKYFSMAYALDRMNPVSCFWLSVISEQRQDFRAAAAYLETSRDLKENPGTALRLSYYRTQAGEFEKAISILEEAHGSWPDNLEVSYFLALGYDDLGKKQEAVSLLKSVLAKKPDHAEARLQLAMMSERDGDMPAAEEHFRYLLARDPGNANILNYLGYALADRGLKLGEAEELIGRAVAMAPNNGAYMDSLAWVHFRQGKYAAALGEIKAALQLINDDPILWDHQGDICSALQDWRSAWRSYSIAYLMSPQEKRKAAGGKISAARERIPGTEAFALRSGLLRELGFFGRDISAFAKVHIAFRGKKIKMDGVLRFSPPDSFSFTLVGPLLAPMWKIKMDGSEVEMDAASMKDLDESAFGYWASLMASELKDYMSGSFLSGAELEKGWNSPRMTGGQSAVVLDGDGNVGAVIPQREKKLEIRFADYFFRNLYLIPGTIEFRIPFFSMKVVLDREKINLKGANSLVP